MKEFFNLLPPLAPDLGRVTEVLDRFVLPEDDLRAVVVNYYLREASGGLARPALVLASAYANQPAQSLQPANESVISAAASIELLNVGTLYQDDVIDADDLRRGVPSANAKWGDGAAILAGDHLMFSALELALDLGVESARDLLSTSFALFRGEMQEVQDRFQINATEQSYLASVSGKQASLTSNACAWGARLSGIDSSGTQALGRYGYELGMAGQIIDDILDLTSTTEFMGKRVGADLRAGVYTLPVIFALRESDDLRALLEHGMNDTTVAEATKIMMACGAIEMAQNSAQEHIDLATNALRGARSPLNDHVVDVLCAFAEEILTGACWRE